MDYYDIFISVLSSTIRLSIPLIFTALAGLFSERAGIFDIGLEGKMLGSAFAAACVAYLTGSAWLGLGAGIICSVALSLVHGFASITNRGNQIISGVAINFFIAGITIVLGGAWFGQGGRTPQLLPDARFAPIVLPGADAIRGVPVIGPLYANVISGNNILTYLAFLAVPLSWWILYRTRFGLRLRAVGENPGAVDTAGISVSWLRYRAVMCAGILCGFSGTYLAIAQSAAFIKDMSAGKGYIALAALVFAKWKPVPVMFACLLFGFLDALANFMQGKQVPLIGEVPVQIFQALPYILTCILLAGFIGVAIPPKAGVSRIRRNVENMSHDLFEAARGAMAFAHAPYSKFPVGAAIRAEDGKVYTGANIENLSFPQGWCAEPTAISAMIMGGAKKIVEMAVIAEKLPLCPPCGGCRQKISEFASKDTKIYLCDEAGVKKTMTMDELLPFSFETKLG